MSFTTKRLSSAADALAPDGSEVRILCSATRGSMAAFSLPPKSISRAVAHRTVEELWYIVSGRGRMWRQDGAMEEVVDIAPGVSVSIPAGTHFQFRCDGFEPLTAIGATMPPWPGEDEAYPVEGRWTASLPGDDAG